MSIQMYCSIESPNCQTEKPFSATAASFLQSLFKGLLVTLCSIIISFIHIKRLTRVVLLFATFIVMVTAIGRVAWACTWLEKASYCQCEIKTSNSVTVVRWNDLYKYCDLAGVSIDNRKLRCAETCANTASPLLDNNSELCKAYGDNLPPSTLSAYSWIDVQSGNISQGHTVSFPGCTKECVYQANGTSLIGCVTYPTGQPPTVLPFTYPPPGILGGGSVCQFGDKVTLIANPIAPQSFYYQWYRNGVKYKTSATPFLDVYEGGRYQVSYANGVYDLGKSSVFEVSQCARGTVWNDINGNKIPDTGEPLLKDVAITSLGDQAGSPTTSTDANGRYVFEGIYSSLNPSTTPPSYSYWFTLSITENEVKKPYIVEVIADGAFTTPLSGYYSPGMSKIYNDYNFGLKLPASVSGKVWNDKNGNGIDDDSTGLANWTVKTKKFATGVVYESKTDADGNYAIYDLAYPSNQEISVTPPSKNWLPTYPTGSLTASIIGQYDTISGKNFGFKEVRWLTVTKSGSGKVTATGIDCGNTCTNSYDYDPLSPVTVTLTAVADPGFSFESWGGDCSGNNLTAKVSMAFDRTCQANFKNLTVDLNKENYACIFGKGQGKKFPWMLKDPTGTLPEKSGEAETPAPDPSDPDANSESAVAFDFAFAMGIKNVASNCIFIKDYTLFVGQSGSSSADCEVNRFVPCQFNPSIILVSKQEMLTSIRGFLFNDLNSNGLQDSNETSLQGWTVVLKKPDGSEISAVSDANGYYQFNQLSASGSYTVTVETRTGATYTTPQKLTRTVDSVNIPIIASFGIKVVEIPKLNLTVATAGGGIISSDPSGILCGSDCSEPYNQGTAVTLKANPLSGYAFKSWSGSCSSATSSTTTLTLNSDMSCSAAFEKLPIASISGSVWNDLNEDGIRQDNESGLFFKGVLLSYKIGTQVFDFFEYTDNNGNYSFKDLSAGEYTVFLETEAGWIQTFPVSLGKHTGSIANYQMITGLNFGMKQIIYFPLTLQKIGNGTVKSSPAGIECGSDCTENYVSGAEINLIATPDTGFSFTNWSGACSGNTNSITVKMDAAKNCVANFAAIPTYTLTVVESGNGIVKSTPAGVNCGDDCSENYALNTQVALTATASADSVFTGWGGACTGATESCQISMSQAQNVTANFAIRKVKLDIMKTGNGTGSIISDPTGISCGNDCAEEYSLDTQITLNALAAPDSLFQGWSGNCSGTNPIITLNLEASKICSANFIKSACNAAALASQLAACNYAYIDCITTDDPVEAVCDAAKTACHSQAQRLYGLCYKLSISKEGTGKGTVQSVGGFGEPINCGSTCESNFAYEDQVTLTATADSGSEFMGWAGDCSGNNTTTTINMNWAKNCKATFKSVAGIIAGDINVSGEPDLADAILTLQVLAGINPPNINVGADVNNDGKIGLEEVVYILQKVAGLR